MSIEAHQSYPDPAPMRRAPLWHRALAGGLKAVVPLLILAVALPYAWNLLHTGPVAERKPRPRVPRLVEVIEVTPHARGPVIEAWGEVRPARTLMLRPEVPGTVTALHPQLTPGGAIAEGETILKLSAGNLRAAIAEAEADIAEIRARIAIEEGQADRARRDADRSGFSLTERQRSLVLREPQMAQLKAELAAAEAALERARLDLDKATIRAPFDMVVMAEEVALGTSLAPATPMATAVAADRFSVVLAVPGSDLGWLDDGSSGEGSVVQLTQPGVWPPYASREARITRRGAQLSETGRMVEMIVEVEDPLSLQPENTGKPKLLLGSFLKAEIEGRPVAEAVQLDRAYLRKDDTVWVMRDDGTMEIRPVDVVWKGAERVLIAGGPGKGGLHEGERVVTTNLAVVADGMKLRLEETATGDDA